MSLLLENYAFLKWVNIRVMKELSKHFILDKLNFWRCVNIWIQNMKMVLKGKMFLPLKCEKNIKTWNLENNVCISVVKTMSRKVIVMNKHQNIKLLSNDMLFHAGGLVLEGFMNLEMAMWSRYPKETVTNCYSNKWPQIAWTILIYTGSMVFMKFYNSCYFLGF